VKKVQEEQYALDVFRKILAVKVEKRDCQKNIVLKNTVYSKVVFKKCNNNVNSEACSKVRLINGYTVDIQENAYLY